MTLMFGAVRVERLETNTEAQTFTIRLIMSDLPAGMFPGYFSFEYCKILAGISVF